MFLHHRARRPAPRHCSRVCWNVDVLKARHGAPATALPMCKRLLADAIRICYISSLLGCRWERICIPKTFPGGQEIYTGAGARCAETRPNRLCVPLPTIYSVQSEAITGHS